MGAVSVVRADGITSAVAHLYKRINTHLRPDVCDALRRALAAETSAVARGVLSSLLENEQISRCEGVPLCQDTGLAVAFVDLGRDVVIKGGTLQEAIDAGIRLAAAEHPLRASTVTHPLGRANAGDNTPAIVHVDHVEGGAVRIRLMAKGGGAENMSRHFMLKPADGRDGVLAAIVRTVSEAGANPCPPVIVGVGLGGNFEQSALLAKRALLRELDSANQDRATAELEAEALSQINALGIGPQGFGGRTTALAVLIETAACHIASLPVAVNVECHSHRHGEVVLRGTKRRLAEP